MSAPQFIVVEAFHKRGETSLKVCGSERELRDYLALFMRSGDRFGQAICDDGGPSPSGSEGGGERGIDALISAALVLGRDLIEHEIDWGVVSVVRVDGRVRKVHSR